MSANFFDFMNPKIDLEEIEVAPEVTLRPYQNEAVACVFSEWEEGAATLVCLPTGCGKSVVFSEVMRRVFTEIAS